MKKSIFTGLLLAVLCLLLIVPAAPAETREAVISLEGEEETYEETLFGSTYGFSFWYPTDGFEAYQGERGNMEGVIVEAAYMDDNMILSVITQEDAEEYVEHLNMDIAAQSAVSRVMVDIYRELENGRFYFLTVIAEKGNYLRIVGEYSEESAEGNGKYMQKILESVSFSSDPSGDPASSGFAIRPEWGREEPDENGRAQVKLTALEPVSDVKLLRLDWDGVEVAWKPLAPLGSFSAQQTVAVTLQFVGDMPDNGVMYTDQAGVEHALALDMSGDDGSLFFWDLKEEP